jgi:AcrR family transcriptional regulator
MPRPFTATERAQISSALQEAARALIVQRGMRHFSVEDLTRAVGISKGAFYRFYPSKEDLIFTVIAAWERDEYHAVLLDALGPASDAPRERVAGMLRRACTLWREHPLFRHFSREDYDVLYRRLAPEQIAAAAQADVNFAATLSARWQAEGIRVRHTPELLIAFLRSLFYVALHEVEFDPTIYPTLLDRLVIMTARELVEES